MPANARCAFQTGNLPRRREISTCSLPQDKEYGHGKQKGGRDSAELIGPAQIEKAPALLHRTNFRDLIEFRRRLIVAIPPQHGFEFLDFRVRLP